MARDARAGQQGVVLELRVDGPLVAEERTVLEQGLKAGLRDQRVGAVDAQERQVVTGGEPRLKNCYTPQCQETIGRLLAAQVVLSAQIKLTRSGNAAADESEPEEEKEKDKGKGKSKSKKSHHRASKPVKDRDEPAPAMPKLPPGDWSLRVEVLDVEVGASGGSAQAECKACTTEDAANKLRTLTKDALAQNAKRPRGVLEVSSEPTNASVHVDSTELGLTPYQRPAFAGIHQIAVRHLGYQSYQTQVEVTAGGTKPVKAQLVAGTDAAAKPVVVVQQVQVVRPVEKTPVYKKPWFWLTMVGIVVVGGAVTAGVLLGTRPAADEQRTQGPYHYSFSF